ncbi:hypothetical protein EOD41_14885 [Mucilaginibacter limnophilus]|uniref:MobA/VirD2-like nuclease domain-containing protein n=1 Tax=Mucilaginibacter limnophilus TaxID=1932778 RepID=A0A3S2XZB8_9SPHI|nr:relaxase/mobilization nuclease domain-containing protein [Mucilaginibacter limnophilus]RVT99727.1 hypothetical protein EOD41_14885 [Mucilaginibacter limnophilus]
MIVRILSSAATFNGVSYNTGKIGRGKGELMKVANFGAFQALSTLRPEDYKHYLKMHSARNKRVSAPQFHAVISSKGKTYSAAELAGIATQWLAEMGYAQQPYLIVYHNDTDNNHVHIVSTRVTADGRKISSAYEHMRAVRSLNRVIGLNEKQTVSSELHKALAYRFSTKAQFALLLERKGYVVKTIADQLSLIKFGSVQERVPVDIVEKRLSAYDKVRAAQLTAIFHKLLRAGGENFTEKLHSQFGIELIYHAKDGKPAYGYTVIDHARRAVFKGSEIMPLKMLLSVLSADRESEKIVQLSSFKPVFDGEYYYDEPVVYDDFNRIGIADDIDDEAIHGPNRRRKRQVGMNTR